MARAAVLRLALGRLGVGESRSIRIQAKQVTSRSRQSSLQRFYRSSDLALLRNESKMAKMALSRQPSGDPPRPQPYSQATRVWAQQPQRLQVHWASGAKTHQEVRFSRAALNSILATEDLRTTCLFKVVVLQTALPEHTQ